MLRPRLAKLLTALRSLSAIASLGCLCSCTGVAVAVAPGHRAVVVAPSGQIGVLDEGVSGVPTDSIIDDFDVTQQAQGGTFTAITKDGVPLVVGDPILNYGVVAEELVAADRSIGPGGARALVVPIVHSIIASVLATYRWEDLNTVGIRDAQARITASAAAKLRPYHIALAQVELKGITPKLPALANAVTETSVLEQRSAEAKSAVDLARNRADALRLKAAGIASSYQSIAPALTPAVLEDKHEKAWQKLLTSPTTTVVVSPVHSPALEISP